MKPTAVWPLAAKYTPRRGKNTLTPPYTSIRERLAQRVVEGSPSLRHKYAAHLRPQGSCGGGILRRQQAPETTTTTTSAPSSPPFSIFSSAPTGSAPRPRSVATRLPSAGLPPRQPLPGRASWTLLLRRRQRFPALACPVGDRCLMTRKGGTARERRVEAFCSVFCRAVKISPARAPSWLHVRKPPGHVLALRTPSREMDRCEVYIVC